LAAAAVTALLAAALLAAPAGAKTKTFSTGATAIPIPDATPFTPSPGYEAGVAVSDLKVTKKGTIKDLNAAVQITHTDTGDLNLYLFKGTSRYSR
jgi:subtilisin-like proprotein convertase family protein